MSSSGRPENVTFKAYVATEQPMSFYRSENISFALKHYSWYNYFSKWLQANEICFPASVSFSFPIFFSVRMSGDQTTALEEQVRSLSEELMQCQVCKNI